MDESMRLQLKVKKALMALQQRNSKCVRDLYESVLRKLPFDSTKRYRKTIQDLPQLSRDVYCMLSLDDEVRNGGFNQYFYNDTGHFAEDAAAAYERFGEVKLAAIVRKAIVVLAAETELQDRVRETGTLDAFAASYAESKLGEVDDDYERAANHNALLEKIAARIRSAE